MMAPEHHAIASGGAIASRAAARLLALQARSILTAAEHVLEAAGEREAVDVARVAGEATTDLLRATSDGSGQVFACKR